MKYKTVQNHISKSEQGRPSEASLISISCKLFHFSRFGVEVFENSSEALTSKVSKIRLVSIGDESKWLCFMCF